MPPESAGGAPGARFNLSEWALHHRLLVLYLIVVFAVVGVFSYQKLGQSEDPPFTFKVMVVQTNWPGRDRARGRAAGHRQDREASCRKCRTRLGAQLFASPASRWCSFVVKDSAPSARDARTSCTRCARRSATSATRCRPASRARSSTTSSATPTATSTRSPATASATRELKELRRPHTRGAAARARRGQGRPDRRAGREDLRRAVERASSPLLGVELGADRRRRSRRRTRSRRPGVLRHGTDRIYLRPTGAFDSRRCDPRHLDPRQRPRVPARRHRRRDARLRRSAAAEDALSAARRRSASASRWRRAATSSSSAATSTRRVARMRSQLPVGVEIEHVAEQPRAVHALGRRIPALAGRGGRASCCS